MRPKPKVALSGSFGHRQITVASTTGVERFSPLADEFTATVFHLQPRDFAISDESDLRDFVDLERQDVSREWKKIDRAYRIGRSGVGSDRLLDIFIRISQRKNAP
jgi:hypothetical protein